MARSSALALVLLTTAASAFAQVPRDPRIDRLQEWMAAVERHQPGTADEAVASLRTWQPSALDDVWADMRAIVALIRDSRARITPSELNLTRRDVRPRRVAYTTNQVRGLQGIAMAIGRRGTVNDVLKRGALLHTDVALLSSATGTSAAARVESTLQQTTLYLDDGRQRGLDQSVDHLEMARRLLDHRAFKTPTGSIRVARRAG